VWVTPLHFLATVSTFKAGTPLLVVSRNHFQVWGSAPCKISYKIIFKTKTVLNWLRGVNRKFATSGGYLKKQVHDEQQRKKNQKHLREKTRIAMRSNGPQKQVITHQTKRKLPRVEAGRLRREKYLLIFIWKINVFARRDTNVERDTCSNSIVIRERTLAENQ